MATVKVRRRERGGGEGRRLFDARARSVRFSTRYLGLDRARRAGLGVAANGTLHAGGWRSRRVAIVMPRCSGGDRKRTLAGQRGSTRARALREALDSFPRRSSPRRHRYLARSRRSSTIVVPSSQPQRNSAEAGSARTSSSRPVRALEDLYHVARPTLDAIGRETADLELVRWSVPPVIHCRSRQPYYKTMTLAAGSWRRRGAGDVQPLYQTTSTSNRSKG